MTRSRLLFLVALALVAGATWLGVLAFRADSHLSDARSSLEAARTHLLDRQLPQAEADVRRAQGETSDARGATRSVLWRGLSHVPLLGRSFRTVSVVAFAADGVTHTTLPQALAAAKKIDPAQLRRSDGSIDLDLVAQARPGVDTALHSAAGWHALAERTPHSLLLPGLGGARQDFLSASQHLTEALLSARRAIDLAPGLLGADRPRRYFVAVQQNAESRGTGGLIGGYAILQASKGRITVVTQGSDRDLYADQRDVEPPAGLPSGFTSAYGPYSIYESWQNINLPPQLPAVAKVVAAKWKARTGEAIDGVVMLDGNALRDLLLGGPPLQVGGKTIRPTDIADYLAIGQYENVSLSNADKTQRKDDLEQVAAEVLQRLTRTGQDSDALLRGFATALRSGHLKMASDDPALKGLGLAGVDGAAPTGAAPVAYPVMFNAEGSKLDLFVERHLDVRCDGSRMTVTMSLKENLPAGDIPPYVGLDLRQNPKVVVTRTDAVHLDVFVTKGATLVRVEKDGKELTGQALAHGVVGGLPFWGADFDLPPQEKHSLTLELDHAATSGSVRIPEQPLARPMTTQVSGC